MNLDETLRRIHTARWDDALAAFREGMREPEIQEYQRAALLDAYTRRAERDDDRTWGRRRRGAPVEETSLERANRVAGELEDAERVLDPRERGGTTR